MSPFSQLVVKSQEWLKLEPEEFQKLLVYIISSKVSVPVETRVVALAVGNALLGSASTLAKRSPIYIAVQFDHDELLPLLLSKFPSFVHAKYDGLTAAHLAAYQKDLTSLVYLFRHDCTTIQDVDDYGMTPFRILYRNFLRLMFRDCHFTGPYPAHIYAYGENPRANLGIGSGKLAAYPSVVDLPRELNQIEHVSLGRFHSLFLVDGKVFACGSGKDGRLGLGDESDVALPRLVPFPERVICVAAGVSHSVVCTAKKIYTFGSNAKSQLGILKKDLLLTPTLAYKLKNAEDNFLRCVACDSYSAAFTEQGRWYIAGSKIPFHSEAVTQFAYYPELHHRDAIMNDLAVVFGAWGSSPKVSVCAKANLIDSHIFHCHLPCTRCLGIFEFSGVCVLVECASRVVRDRPSKDAPTYIILSEHLAGIPVKISVEFLDSTNQFPLKLRKTTVAKNGGLLIADEAGLVYEGNLCEALRTHSSNYLQGGSLPVHMERIVGLPPARDVYISPDGKNKALAICDLTLKGFDWIDFCSLPKGTFLHLSMCYILVFSTFTAVSEPVRNVKAICVKDDFTEVASFNTCRNYLAKESAYCAAFFSRWSPSNKKAKLSIRFFASPFAVDQFVLFCATHQISSGLTSSQLFELLLFADAYCCDNFFDYVVDQYLTDQFDITVLRDLYSIARVVKNPRLVSIVNGLCAVFFPILLDRGFINDLTDEEVHNLKNFYKTIYYSGVIPLLESDDLPFLLDNCFEMAGFQQESWIKHDYDMDDIKRLQQVTNECQQNEKVNVWLLKLAREIEAGGERYLSDLSDSFKKSAKVRLTATRRQHRDVQEEGNRGNGEQLVERLQHFDISQNQNETFKLGIGSSVTTSSGWKGTSQEISSNEIPTITQPIVSKQSELLEGSFPNILDGSLVEKRDGKLAVRKAHSRPSDDLVRFSSSGNPSQKMVGWTITSEQSQSLEPSFRDIVEGELANERVQLVLSNHKNVGKGKSLFRYIEGCSESQYMPLFLINKGLAQGLLRFFRKITNERDLNWNALSPSPPHSKAAWNSVAIAEREVTTSFQEIVNDEVAQQDEAQRVVNTHVTDIETEEHAISELIAVYEADAARYDSAATISVERMQSTRSDPLWSARRDSS